MKRIFSWLMLVMVIFSMVMPMTTSLHAETVSGSTGIKDFLAGITLDPSTGEAKTETLDDPDKSLSFAKIFSKYKLLALFITGVLTITSFFALFVNIGKLSTALDNEFTRRRLYMGIATSAVGVILMGGASAIIAFFYQFL